MPKVIQPRRHDKQLSVEEFWKIRDEGKQQRQDNPFHSYRESEVEQRHRYQKPSEQAKTFNPLALTLKRQERSDIATNDLYAIGTEDQNTFVGEYLSNAQNKVNSAIYEVKKWTMGRQSIIYNLEKIYSLLWSNLYLEQSWQLLQAVIKDSRGVNLSIWLQNGFKVLSQTAAETCAANFSKPFFKNLFDTLCVFMETYYDEIIEQLENFFLQFAEQFMKHQNKYMRRFSIQAFSYILSNLPEDQYQKFLHHLVERQGEGFFDEKVSLADMLLQRLKIVKGCLTTASMTHFLAQLQNLQDIFAKQQANEEHFLSITSDYIGLVLDSLNCKQGANESQLLFDFIYVIKALITFAQKNNAGKYGNILVMGFSNFLSTYHTDKKKFSPYNGAQNYYMKQLWEVFGQFYKKNVQYFTPREQLNHAVAVLTIKCGSSFYYSSQIINYCKQHEEITKTIIKYVYEHDQTLDAGIMEVILLLSHNILRNFVLEDTQTANVYSLIVLIKRFGLNKLIDLNWLQLTEQNLYAKLDRASFEFDLIVILRLLAFIKISESSHASMLKHTNAIYNKFMTPYEQHIKNLSLGQSNNHLKGQEFYNYINFTREIIVYAHHQIGWLSHIFNIYEAFTLLSQHLGLAAFQSSSIWDDLIISRPSALSILSAKGRFDGNSSNNALIINLLSSRNREVRYNCLLIVAKQFQHNFSSTLLQWLQNIDQSHIDLDNQRQVKRIFCNIEQHIITMPQQIKNSSQIQQLFNILIKWCIGFAFTGFKLIQNAFGSFLKSLLDSDMHAKCPQMIQNTLMPFLQYYNYRHSRQYEFDISSDAPVSHLTNAFTINTNEEIKKFVREDLQITNLETVQWIGLERIADAVKTSKNAKKHLGTLLLSMIQAYFDVEFKRQANTIESLSQDTPKPFLLPVKVRFLINILKLCPQSYLPPFQCLHFTRQIYFELDSVRNIKRNNWQTMWQKKGDHPKKKADIADIASTTINLQHLSAQEQRMYISYLWKDILQANRHKKRIIMDHIRNYIPSATPLLFELLFQHLHLSSLSTEKVDEQTVNRIVNRLRLMNRKNLLNGMFILKAILIHLRQEVNIDNRLKVISLFILSLIQIVYTTAAEQNIQDNEEEEEIQQSEEEEKEAEENNNQYFQYKQHRKQLQKLLQTLFSKHDLQVQNITELLQFLFVNTKINLSKSARLSVPGLLHILKIISGQKQYGVVLVSALNGEIITMLSQMIKADENNQRPLRHCFQIWIQVTSNLLLSNEETQERENIYQAQIQEKIQNHSSTILSALLSHINASNSTHEAITETLKQQSKRREQQSLTILKLISHLIQLAQEQPEQQWQKFIWQQLNKISKIKRNLSALHCQKLSLLIVILSRYIRLRGSNVRPASGNFLKKIISVLPTIRDPQQRLQILELMINNYEELGLSQANVQLVSKMGQLKKTALIITMDFPAFFQACNQYSQQGDTFKLIDHEYFLYNLACYADNEQLSVRRAVSNSCKRFLEVISLRIKTEPMAGQDEPEDPQTGAIFLALKIYRVFLQMLSKQKIQHNEQVYWNIIDNIELFFSWLTINADTITSLLPKSNVKLYSAIAPINQQDKSYFKLMGSISQSNKLKGLKLIKATLESVLPQVKNEIVQWANETDTIFPNPISKIILPILEYLIFKPTDHNEGVKSNLSSTFSKNSLELLPLVASFLKDSTVKKQLKRLISKIKFSQSENKRNTALIKMIGALIDGVAGEKVNERLQSYLQEHGFERFHEKITQFSKSISKQAQIDNDDDDESYDGVRNPAKRERIPDYFQNLDELQSEEAINRNFLHFDRKMMDLQGEQQQADQQMFPTFLKKHVLLPLRTMLMKQSKGNGKNKDKAQQQSNNKSQILLSVTITKVLLRLPLDVFLREFQKVVSRLGRLLKKREVEVRDNARNCLCQIARSVGSQLLYAIIIQLKFHLKDNFDKHVLNYSLFKVLQAMNLSGGAIDYCLPLILPSVIDQIFGQSSNEKEMVEKREVRTLKMEAKKQKGLQILQIVCKTISSDRIGYIIQFLEKYLREHLVTEVNLGKYDHMLGAITAGLAHNPSALDSQNTPILLPILSQPVSKLREQVRQLIWDDSAKHQNTLKKQWKRVKAGKEQVLALQEQAGRNKSIFKKLSKEVGQRRNMEIIASSLIQFYLALLSFFLRRQVFTLASITTKSQLSAHFLTLLGFLGECVDQRDNRLVTKSLKTLHIALSWNTSSLTGDLQPVGDRFKSIKKQTSRKILLLVQQLTLADEQLLKECFVFLNDLVSEAAMTLQMLPNFISVIKLHTPTTQDQPHLPQTYQLLRTLLFKCPQYLYHPLLDDLHLFTRLQLPTCRNKEIRDLACSILSVYLRPRKALEPSVIAFNQSQKKHGRGELDYSKRLQQELTFYLSNLQCAGQEGVLRLLEQFVQNRQPDEVQTYAQLLLLGLMTARTNQVQRDSQHPADSLIIKIIQRINAGKVAGLVEKCLLWTGQARYSSIRLCGVSFLRIILTNSPIKISQNFIEKYVLNPGGLLVRAEAILKEEVQVLQTYNAQERNTRKLDNQWNDILNEMNVEQGKYVCDPSIIQLLLLLTHLFQNSTIPATHSGSLKTIIIHCWQLLHAKDVALVQTIISCLLKVNLLPALLGHSQANDGIFENAKESFSIKKTTSALIFNHNKSDIIEQLLRKIITQEIKLNIVGSPNLKAISWLFVGLALKAHIKATIYQQVLPAIMQLLNKLTLLKQSNELNFRSTMFGQPNFQEKLLQLSIKLSSNSLINFQNKSLVEQTTQILKEHMGVAEYFRAVGDYEVKKRVKKEGEKARIAEMAILNPQEYIDEKRGRKRV